MTNKQQAEILNKPFWTFDEIMNLAVTRWQEKNKLGTKLEAQEFLVGLLDNLIDAINTYEITALSPMLTERNKFEGYTTPVKIYGGASLIVVLALMLKYMAGNKDILEGVLKFEPNFDPIAILIKCTVFISAAVIIRFLIAIFSLGYFLWLYLKRNSLSGKVKYLIAHVKHNGMAVALYESGGVISFLNSRYDLEIDEDVDDASCKIVVPQNGSPLNETPCPDKLKANILKLELLRKPADSELQKKMTDLANRKHQPLNDAKDKIIEFIRIEAQPPCCCYHSQIVKHILKLVKKAGSPISLKYGNLGDEKELSPRVLLDLAYEEIKKIDGTRVHTINVKYPFCEKHSIKRR